MTKFRFNLSCCRFRHEKKEGMAINWFNSSFLKSLFFSLNIFFFWLYQAQTSHHSATIIVSFVSFSLIACWSIESSQSKERTIPINELEWLFRPPDILNVNFTKEKKSAVIRVGKCTMMTFH